MSSEFTDRFKVGNEVRVLTSVSSEFEDVKKFIDKTGVVEYVDTSDTKYPYRVVFETVWKMNFSEAELELVNHNNVPLSKIVSPCCHTNNKSTNTDITLTLKDIEKLNQFNSVFHDSKHLVELLNSLGNHKQANELMQNLLSVKEVVDNIDKQRNQITKELIKKSVIYD